MSNVAYIGLTINVGFIGMCSVCCSIGLPQEGLPQVDNFMLAFVFIGNSIVLEQNLLFSSTKKEYLFSLCSCKSSVTRTHAYFYAFKMRQRKILAI